VASNWKWYGVKTVYRVEPQGSPGATDSEYWPDGSLVEERVVVFRARSCEEAVRKAEREAKNYTSLCTDRNPYGQRLLRRYLGFCDAYTYVDRTLESGTEVYSMTELVPRAVADASVVQRRIGREESGRDRGRRKNFCLLLFSGPVPGVRPTRAEVEEARRFRESREKHK
jgi:hypothetical protein